MTDSTQEETDIENSIDLGIEFYAFIGGMLKDYDQASEGEEQKQALSQQQQPAHN